MSDISYGPGMVDVVTKENRRLRAFIWLLSENLLKPDFARRSAAEECRRVANGLMDLSYLDEVKVA